MATQRTAKFGLMGRVKGGFTWIKANRTKLAKTTAAVAVVGGVYFGLSLLAERSADKLLSKGFGAIAADRLWAFRPILERRVSGCRLLVASYFQSREVNELDRVSQRCLENGINIPEPYIGLGAVREFTGRDQDALQLLAQVLPTFEKLPDIHLRIGIILRRLKNIEPAIQSYAKAAEMAPSNPQLQVDTLAFMAEQGKWKEALPVANRLRETQTDNPEIKLLVARALQKNGDSGTAQMLAEQASGLMGKLQVQAKEYLDKNYGDILALVKKQADPSEKARGNEAGVAASRQVASEPAQAKKSRK